MFGEDVIEYGGIWTARENGIVALGYVDFGADDEGFGVGFIHEVAGEVETSDGGDAGQVDNLGHIAFHLVADIFAFFDGEAVLDSIHGLALHELDYDPSVSEVVFWEGVVGDDSGHGDCGFLSEVGHGGNFA